ncbi:MAG: hypothetical protein H6R24_1573, partial [Proteobacteria bacterium]|nr:hypothetical protein [Pseudomonadota bacterium]
FRCFTFGFERRLPLGFRCRFALGLFRCFTFGFECRLPLGFRCRLTFSLFSGLAPGFLGGLTARFFFVLATNFRLTACLSFPFRPRQSSLPVRFLALAATLFLSLSFQFFPDRSLVYYLRLDRFDFLPFGVRRAG